MSQIPSDIAVSGLGAGYHAREAARPRDAERAAESTAARQEARAIDDAGRSVETTDDDTQIFADAEGAGSQGRPFADAEANEDSEEDPEAPPGISTGPDGRPRIDLQA